MQAELIAYDRDEAAPDRPSDYQIARTPDGAALREVLADALGVLAVVRKRRTLLLLDTTRVHLDNVDELGSFLEIEVPVREDVAAAEAQLASLIEALGFERADGIRSSYVDIMLEQTAARNA